MRRTISSFVPRRAIIDLGLPRALMYSAIAAITLGVYLVNDYNFGIATIIGGCGLLLASFVECLRNS